MTTIQKATIEDAATIAEIGKISFLESHGLSATSLDIEDYVSRKYTVDAVKEELSDPENIYHLLYVSDRPAGYSKMILNTANENVPFQNVATLDRLYLLKEFYDLKLGRQLFEHNIQIAENAEQKGIWLYVWTENKRAIRFYERAGFKIVGSTYFKISATHSNPNHIMYLQF